MSGCHPHHSLERARKHWGNALPAWVEALAYHCDNTSQKRASKTLDMPAGAISGIIGRSYPGNWLAMELRVRKALNLREGDRLCPILGWIAYETCQHHQKQPYMATSSVRVRLWRACKHCHHNLEKDHEQ